MEKEPHRWPWLTLSTLAVSAALCFFPEANTAALGERGLLSAGEFWRAWTANLAHYSTGHFLASGLVWLVAGWQVERSHRMALASLLALGAPLITWAALAGDLELARYAGLSGLGTATVVLLGWNTLSECKGGRRWLGAVLLALVAAKVGHEFWAGPEVSPTLSPAQEGVRVAVWAHVAGAVAGSVAALGVWLWGRGGKGDA